MTRGPVRFEIHTAEQIAAADELRSRSQTVSDAERVLAQAVTLAQDAISSALTAGIPAERIVPLMAGSAELSHLAKSLLETCVRDEQRRIERESEKSAS